MNINRENYEAYFIDYLDGNLSDTLIYEVEAFLMKNDDLRDEFEGLEKIIVAPEKTNFNFKESLKQPDLERSIDESNFEFYIIAEMEGDLSKSQLDDLENYLILNPEKRQIQAIFHQTRIEAPQNVIFNSKQSLKKSGLQLGKIAVYRSLSIAAGIALLLALFFTFIENDDLESIIVAEDIPTVEKADTSAINIKNSTKSENLLKNKANDRIKPVKEKIKIRSSAINFKVGIPIAAAEENSRPQKEEGVPTEKLEKRFFGNSIDTRAVTDSKILTANFIDKIESKKIYPRSKNKQVASEFLTLPEIARQKYTDLVFQDEERKPGFWNVASAGVNRISDITGTSLSLKTVQNEAGEDKKISFNSKLLSFSTPINRE